MLAQEVWSGAWFPAFLIGAKGMLMVLVWGPYFQKLGIRGSSSLGKKKNVFKPWGSWIRFPLAEDALVEGREGTFYWILPCTYHTGICMRWSPGRLSTNIFSLRNSGFGVRRYHFTSQLSHFLSIVTFGKLLSSLRVVVRMKWDNINPFILASQ